MKKIISLITVSLCLLVGGIQVSANDEVVQMARDLGYAATADIAPKSAIIVDAETGQIVYSYNMDLQRDPASTTKTMVVYLTMEAIKEGRISMDTEVVATATDQAIADIYALSNNKIVAGVTYTVRELLYMTFVPSSNVTTLMLAHLIFDGTDAQFIEKMNQTAQDLGMENTVFHNATGAVVEAFGGYYAPEGYDHTTYNLTTTKDLAILAHHLITKYPEVLEFTKDRVVTVKEGTPYEETFESYNHSLVGDELGIVGVDGLKTGSSPSAGYNAIVTAERGNQRYIVVVLGASQWGDPDGEYVRHYFVNGLLEHAFKTYERREILSVGKHKIDGVTYKLEQPLTVLLEKNAELPSVVASDGQLAISGMESVTGQVAVAAIEQRNLFSLTNKTSENSGQMFSWGKYFFVGVLALLILVLLIFYLTL